MFNLGKPTCRIKVVSYQGGFCNIYLTISKYHITIRALKAKVMRGKEVRVDKTTLRFCVTGGTIHNIQNQDLELNMYQ